MLFEAIADAKDVNAVELQRLVEAGANVRKAMRPFGPQ